MKGDVGRVQKHQSYHSLTQPREIKVRPECQVLQVTWKSMFLCVWGWGGKHVYKLTGKQWAAALCGTLPTSKTICIYSYSRVSSQVSRERDGKDWLGRNRTASYRILKTALKYCEARMDEEGAQRNTVLWHQELGLACHFTDLVNWSIIHLKALGFLMQRTSSDWKTIHLH